MRRCVRRRGAYNRSPVRLFVHMGRRRALAALLAGSLASAGEACRTTLQRSGRIELTRASEGTVVGSTVISNRNVNILSGASELTLDQRPCFDVQGNNLCCSDDGVCHSWSGSAVESLDCVDTGIVHLTYSLSDGATVYAPLTNWPLPAGSGRVSIARARDWTAVVGGGNVLANITRRTRTVDPITQQLVSRTGSAPYYEILSRPPGIGTSGNSGAQRFMAPVGAVRGPDGSVMFVNNASRIHLTAVPPSTGACSPCSRSSERTPVVRLATPEEVAATQITFADAVTLKISEMRFEPISAYPSDMFLDSAPKFAPLPKQAKASNFAGSAIPRVGPTAHMFASPRVRAPPPARPPASSSHVATIAFNTTWEATSLSNHISARALSSAHADVYKCTLVTTQPNLPSADAVSEKIAEVAHVSDVGVDCNAERCVFIVGRPDVRGPAVRAALDVPCTVTQSSCAAVSVASTASDERVALALSSIPNQVGGSAPFNPRACGEPCAKCETD